MPDKGGVLLERIVGEEGMNAACPADDGAWQTLLVGAVCGGVLGLLPDEKWAA